MITPQPVAPFRQKFRKVQSLECMCAAAAMGQLCVTKTRAGKRLAYLMMDGVPAATPRASTLMAWDGPG
jgi:hypothetical protein